MTLRTVETGRAKLTVKDTGVGAQVSPHFFRCNFNDIGVGSDQLLCISAGESAPIDFKEW